jgi:hypothetical protein
MCVSANRSEAEDVWGGGGGVTVLVNVYDRGACLLRV